MPALHFISPDSFKKTLQEMFGKECEKSPMRTYKERGELPKPIRIMGKKFWTVGFLVRFIEQRQC